MRTLVFLDLETGGLRPLLDPIIQIAAVAIDGSSKAESGDWSELEVFERKLQFDPNTCNREALAINTYSSNGEATWAREAVPERQALFEFKEFLSRHATIGLVSKKSSRPYYVAQAGGHNIARFDIPFLQAAFERHKLFLPLRLNVILDTIHGAAWHFADGEPEPDSFKLVDLGKHFSLPVQGELHDALTDCRLSAALARRLILR